jgi:hypothetical protein
MHPHRPGLEKQRHLGTVQQYLLMRINKIFELNFCAGQNAPEYFI